MKQHNNLSAPVGHQFTVRVAGYRIDIANYYCDAFGVTVDGQDAGIIFYSDRGRRGRNWMTGAGLLFPTASHAIAHLCRTVHPNGRSKH